MRIGFLKHGSSISASTRVRVDFVLPYMSNAIASNEADNLSECQAIVFQKRYKEQDCYWAKYFKKCNKIVIFDLTDPVWDKDYPGVYFPITKDSEEYFYMMCQLADCITFCTPKLEEMFIETFSDRFNTKVIPDRIDLAKHKPKKKHKKREQYIIGWHGTKFNVPMLDFIREDLEMLYKEIPFQLNIIHERGAKQLDLFNFPSLYKEWSLDTINRELLQCDITVNPHPENSYKSNNKTIKSWALGIPCVEENFYENCRNYLLSEKLRSDMAIGWAVKIKNFYDSKISAKEIEELCNALRKV